MMEIDMFDLINAAIQWWKVVPEDEYLEVFFDFIDPTRQTDLRYTFVGRHWMEPLAGIFGINEQIVDRVKKMAGPHGETLIRANADRRKRVAGLWGKKQAQKFL